MSDLTSVISISPIIVKTAQTAAPNSSGQKGFGNWVKKKITK
jgi:hypothetical protein